MCSAMSGVGQGSTGEAMRMFLFGDMGDPKVFSSELGGGGEVSWRGEMMEMRGNEGGLLGWQRHVDLSASWNSHARRKIR